jgi:hypothetical protein
MAQTPMTLYRKGNASRTKLDHLRNEDVEIFTDSAQTQICVRLTNTTGVSCYDNLAALVGLGGTTWELPNNSDYDDMRLLLWKDEPDSDHWNWTPARDMPGSEFIDALRAVEKKFNSLPP